jgi:hypothetical protein
VTVAILVTAGPGSAVEGRVRVAAGKTMASDNQKSKTQKSKTDAAAKKDAAAKAESPSAKDIPKEAAKDTPKPEGGETATAAPSNYSRGEGQKPVTAAYKENWNAIFGKKRTKRKKR